MFRADVRDHKPGSRPDRTAEIGYEIERAAILTRAMTPRTLAWWRH